ncbi:MAG: NAD(P)-dependent oxidoreductase [Anaerolineales bacterium]|nr:NAD(P)-dependent oxidoreductase [Anaerolineales bacterium]
MKKILITGAHGLLGHQVCNDGINQGYDVVALTHSTPTKPIQGVTYLTVDFTSTWDSVTLPDRVDAIIHLAQSSKFRNFPDSALDVFQVNTASTAKLLDYAKRTGVKKFIFASSGGIYGNGQQAHKETGTILSPVELDYYLASKLASEMLVQNYSSIFQTIILRFFFIYGPRQNRSMLLPRLMDNIAQGKKITLKGRDGLRINPVHVADAAAAVLASLGTMESGIINVAGPDILSIRQICMAMGAYLGSQPVFEQQEGTPSNLIGDIQKMKEKLHQPEIRLMDSFSELQSPSKK